MTLPDDSTPDRSVFDEDRPVHFDEEEGEGTLSLDHWSGFDTNEEYYGER